MRNETLHVLNSCWFSRRCKTRK